jgi:hypothetical protein
VIISGGLFVVGIVQGGGLTQALQVSGAAMVITSLEGLAADAPTDGKGRAYERVGRLHRTDAVDVGLGAWGTVLAVPMLVIIKSTADHVPRLRPVGL